MAKQQESMKQLFLLSLFIFSFHLCAGKSSHLCAYKSTSWVKGTVKYALLEYVIPGQVEYSLLNVDRKVEKAIKDGDVKKHKIKKGNRKKKKKGNKKAPKFNWILPYNNHTSLMDISDPLPVIATKEGLMLLDGHHSTMTSIRFKAKSIPVKVVEDFRHLEMKEFIKVAKQKDWVFLENKDGKVFSAPPTDFNKLTDNPNRLLISLIARKLNPDEFDLSESRGHEYPVWFKFGREKPFIEFHMALALYKKGFEYRPKQHDFEDKELLREVLKLLKNSKLPKVNLVDDIKHYSKYELDEFDR